LWIEEMSIGNFIHEESIGNFIHEVLLHGEYGGGLWIEEMSMS
jgi:hypothetical protein